MEKCVGFTAAETSAEVGNEVCAVVNDMAKFVSLLVPGECVRKSDAEICSLFLDLELRAPEVKLNVSGIVSGESGFRV